MKAKQSLNNVSDTVRTSRPFPKLKLAYEEGEQGIRVVLTVSSKNQVEDAAPSALLTMSSLPEQITYISFVVFTPLLFSFSE